MRVLWSEREAIMHPKWQNQLSMAILLAVLAAFVLTSFGCKTKKKDGHWFGGGNPTVRTP